MFKKLAIASAVLAISTSVAFAGHNYKGDYKGEACPTYTYLMGPYLGLSVGVRNNYTGTPAVYKGIEGTLSAGYGAFWDAFYLAGELFVGDSIQVKNYTSEATGVNVKSSWSYGFDLIPGYLITDYVLTYLRVGVIETRFSGAGVNKTGWRVGLGGQTNIWQNWDLRGEYVYNQYGRVDGANAAADLFNLGVVYKFV